MYLSHIFPRPSLVALLFLSASNTDTSTRFDFPAFLPYDYDSPRRASLRALRIAFWKYLSLIRGWLPPWKQQLLPHLAQATHSQPLRYPLRLLSALTVRRERFQWKRKMTRKHLSISL